MRKLFFISAGLLVSGCAEVPPRRPAVPTLPAPEEISAHKPCSSGAAVSAAKRAAELLERKNLPAALRTYGRCLAVEPDCEDCLENIGWAYWQAGRCDSALSAWEKLASLNPKNPALYFLDAVRKDLEARRKLRERKVSIAHPDIGTRSLPADSPVSLELSARFQFYDPAPDGENDSFDWEIDSPKSASFSADGKKVYVNSLEAAKTIIYDSATFAKKKTIYHSFAKSDSGLFLETAPPFGYSYGGALPFGANPNVFVGKPVELALSHAGRYLWIPYYRRSFDRAGLGPSAVAVVDTSKDKIVRVMASGPVSKYALASPDGRLLAVTNWGDNSVIFLDISSASPSGFSYAGRVAVDDPPELPYGSDFNRDTECGSCLRGLAFSSDSRYLFVARMGSGGVAAIKLDGQTPVCAGTFAGMKPNPRDVVISPDGKWLYTSATQSGYISRVEVSRATETLSSENGRAGEHAVFVSGFEHVNVGEGPRTIRFSPDGKYLFAAINVASKIVVVDALAMKEVSSVAADPYPVGLAISPDGSQLWVTSQSRGGAGGDSVAVYSVTYSTQSAAAR